MRHTQIDQEGDVEFHRNGHLDMLLVPLGIIVLVLGIYPSPMLDLMNSSANALVDFVKSGSGMVLLGR